MHCYFLSFNRGIIPSKMTEICCIRYLETHETVNAVILDIKLSAEGIQHLQRKLTDTLRVCTLHLPVSEVQCPDPKRRLSILRDSLDSSNNFFLSITYLSNCA